jgi:ferredoxin
MNVEIRYFSATGITHNIVTEFARGLGYNTRFVDITLPKNRIDGISGDANLEVFAVPVHGERIPGFIYRYLQNIKGNGRPLVTLAVYGNMGIGISLGQFDQLANETGFRLVAAGAFVGEHTFCRFGALRQAQGTDQIQAQGKALRQAQGASLRQALGPVNHVGMGRPDQYDLMEIFKFGQKVKEKLDQALVDTISLPKPIIPMFIAGFPERGTRFIVRQPDADPVICKSCGICVNQCPVGAINAHSYQIDGSKCIRCMACVHNCPVLARTSEFKFAVIDYAFGWMGQKYKPNLVYL